MGLRIELERLWKRLQTRFKARRKTDTDPEDPDHPVLLETVQPITDFDELAKEGKVINSTADLSGGGNVTVFTVPDGKRWRILHLRKAATDGTVPLTIVDTSENLTDRIVEGSTGATNFTGNPPTLDEKDIIRASSGAVGDAAILFTGFVEEEDAF